MMPVVDALLKALGLAFAMTWEITWALALGFTLSGIVQAVVSKREMSRLLPDDSPKSLAIACGLGAASSSCSYAAVALARSIFRKGANFTAAMAFELASTNLLVELGIMAILLGWQFTAAEFVGAPIMVALMAPLFRRFLSRDLVEQAHQEAASSSRMRRSLAARNSRVLAAVRSGAGVKRRRAWFCRCRSRSIRSRNAAPGA
jgi:uncharacterized membrane protein YraQ (UPF0718 family)